MMTFFTTAKPFSGHSGVIQRNALKSWKLLHPDAEVILFGDEEGAAEVCAELGLRHEPHVERHESGFKYLNYMFERAQRIARHDYLCYCNCDIILGQDFRLALAKVAEWRKEFLLIGRRWDTDVTEPIDFSRQDWEAGVRQRALTANVQQAFHFVDFFAFSKDLYEAVPPLVVGRSYWDHWLVWKALSKGVCVVDASHFVIPVHQNHDYSYHPLGKQGTNEDELARRNIEVAGGRRHLRTLIHSTHGITRNGGIRRTPFRSLFQNDTVLAMRQALLEQTFALRSRLGLRRAVLKKLWE
jgi:hypothetical protein